MRNIPQTLHYDAIIQRVWRCDIWYLPSFAVFVNYIVLMFLFLGSLVSIWLVIYRMNFRFRFYLLSHRSHSDSILIPYLYIAEDVIFQVAIVVLVFMLVMSVTHSNILNNSTSSPPMCFSYTFISTYLFIMLSQSSYFLIRCADN